MSEQETALMIAFVQGAQWWEWYKENATMWTSDRDRAEQAAKSRLADGTLGKHTDEILRGMKYENP